MATKDKIILIDGSGYIFRAFYAVRRLSTSKGFPTNAVFGFVQMLLKVIQDEKPKYLGIAFDTSKPTFRKEKYAEYKSNREAPPEDLVSQFPVIHEAVEAFGIKSLVLAGYEADDLIGTLAVEAVKKGYQVEVISADKDLMQLVNESVIQYDTMKDKRYDRAAVLEKLGVYPEQVTDYLALVGDSSDNIPGVTGIGEKSAKELIQKFGGLDNLYKRLDEIPQEKRREILKAEKDTAYLGKELATLHLKVPMECELGDLKYLEPDPVKVAAFCEKYEFFQLMKRLGIEASAEKKETAIDRSVYKTVDTEQAFEAFFTELKKAKQFVFDTETTSLRIHEAQCVGVSFALSKGKAYYIPVCHMERTPTGEVVRVAPQLEADFVWKKLKPIFEDLNIGKIGQNLKYDLQILKTVGINVQGVVADTFLESYLLDSDESHGLDAMARKYLRHEMISYEDVTGKGKAQISFAEVPIAKATEYSAEDADVTYQIHSLLYPELEKNGLKDLYQNVELPLMEVLMEMEYEGVKIDRDVLVDIGSKLEVEMKKSEAQVYELAGGPFNIQSPKQLSTVLFEKLNLPIIRRTKTGISTDESVLQELASKHAICERILKYRELAKIKSTYVEGILEVLSPKTGRVHTNYNQTVTATGRLSSSSPNLQNIPVGKAHEYDVRRAFITDPGKRILSADYSQIELRLLADFSGDPELIRAFENDEDIHSFTARLIFNHKEVTPEQRKIAKTINFGVIYGQSPYGLSQMLKISTTEAKDFIDRYFQRYSKIKECLQGFVEDARKVGYAKTRMGRRRYLREILSQNRMRREMSERAALNTPLQGTAADLIKIAMINLAKNLKLKNLESRMILQVHDELVLEVPKKEEAEVEKLVCREMETAMLLKIPLKVEVGWGDNWAEVT